MKYTLSMKIRTSIYHCGVNKCSVSNFEVVIKDVNREMKKGGMYNGRDIVRVTTKMSMLVRIEKTQYFLISYFISFIFVVAYIQI